MARKDKPISDAGSNNSRYLRYAAVGLLLGAMTLGWLSLLTFHAGDWPSNSVYPAPPVANAAGKVGAFIAYESLYWVGGGVYMALVFGTACGLLMVFGGRVTDTWWRITGLALLTAACSAALYLAKTTGPSPDVIGSAAGVVGSGAGEFLRSRFAPVGAWIILVVTFGIGLMLTADNLVMQIPRFGRKVWDYRNELPGMGDKADDGSLHQQKPVAAAPATLPATFLKNKPSADAPTKAASAASTMPLPTTKPAPAVASPAPKPAVPPAVIGPVAASPTGKIEPAKLVVTPNVESPKPPLRPGGFANPAMNAGAPAGSAPSASAPAAGGTYAPAAPAAACSAAAPATANSANASSPAAPAKAPVSVAPPKADSKAETKPDAKSPAAATAAGADAPAIPEVQFILPSAELLAEPSVSLHESRELHAAQKREVLQQTLTNFAVAAEVVGFMTGPVITMFELALSPGVKVAQVANLANDIARALAVPGVRIVSPLPGRDTVGIEVPNMQKEIVRIRELMTLAPQAEEKYALPLYLGKDASGSPLVADLSSMPHMLIAGTTGSGKSVCINTIIISLLMTRRPQDVRFILVDPKMVEMAAFENLPHLLCPIVNDMRRAEEILEWAVQKMDERYELLKEANVKHISEFNRLSKEEIWQRFEVASEQEKAHVPTHLPYYVIIIDELADLIMTSSKEVEQYIIRVAQKARAVGIHLILATQRPSVNVVTGLIKSNMPCRISFRVASRQESRIVLDQNGADVLLGRGDMLMLQPGTSSLVRAQGAYVDDSEIRTVVTALRAGGEPQYEAELVKLSAGAGLEAGGERDEFFDQAVEIVLQSQRGSVSLLQRRLQVGYSRASRIIDQMAEAGILGDYKGSQARECNMTLEDWQALKSSIAADQSGDSAANGEPTSS